MHELELYILKIFYFYIRLLKSVGGNFYDIGTYIYYAIKLFVNRIGIFMLNFSIKNHEEKYITKTVFLYKKLMM